MGKDPNRNWDIMFEGKRFWGLVIEKIISYFRRSASEMSGAGLSPSSVRIWFKCTAKLLDGFFQILPVASPRQYALRESHVQLNISTGYS